MTVVRTMSAAIAVVGFSMAPLSSQQEIDPNLLFVRVQTPLFAPAAFPNQCLADRSPTGNPRRWRSQRPRTEHSSASLLTAAKRMSVGDGRSHPSWRRSSSRLWLDWLMEVSTSTARQSDYGVVHLRPNRPRWNHPSTSARARTILPRPARDR